MEPRRPVIGGLSSLTHIIPAFVHGTQAANGLGDGSHGWWRTVEPTAHEAHTTVSPMVVTYFADGSRPDGLAER